MYIPRSNWNTPNPNHHQHPQPSIGPEGFWEFAAAMFVPKHWTSPNKPSNRDSRPYPKWTASRSGDVEMQTHAPSTGSFSVSISETLHEKSTSQSGLKGYFMSDIDKKWTEILLLACGFCSGLVDGLSFAYWWSFSNMQTGRILPDRFHDSTFSNAIPIKQGTSSGLPSAYQANRTIQINYG